MNGLSPAQKSEQLDALRHAMTVIEALPVTRACCNCEHFDKAGGCSEFEAMPPADYQHGDNGCAQWMEEVPF